MYEPSDMLYSRAVSMLWQGVMSEAIPWKLLQDQYFSDSSYEDEIAKLVHSPEEVCCCCCFSSSRASLIPYIVIE